MPQERPPTPEKQLLKLIEESSSQNTSLKAAALKHQSLSLLSLEAWQGRLSFLIKEIITWSKGEGWKKLEIKTVNNILVSLIFILALYSIVNFYFSMKYVKAAPLQFKHLQISKPAVPQETSVLKVVSYYLEKARSRDIFKISVKKTSENGKNENAKVPSVAITEATKDLKLVGISWSNDPDIMIEDTKTQRTYFLKKGQVIDPLGMKIEAVFKDKVIVSYGGEEIELR